MHPNGPGGPPPGWYPDPAGERAWRWWDGQAWSPYASDPSGPQAAGSAAVQPARFAAAAGASPGASVHERMAAELRDGPWARWAVLAYVVALALGMLSSWAESSSLREMIHTIRVQMQTGIVQNPQTQSARFNLYSLLELMLLAPFYILFLRWQFQAAKTARGLFLPARRSAGLGVGSWFIPVVSLWFPYQSIRDCLPPDDPGRAVVGRMWAFFIATLVMNVVTEVFALLGNPIGFVFAAVTLGLAVGFALAGAKTVEVIAQTHRRLLSPGPSGRP